MLQREEAVGGERNMLTLSDPRLEKEIRYDPMLPEDVAEALSDVREQIGNDTEVRHALMDDVLCAVLEANGYSKAVRVFTETEKWCA